MGRKEERILDPASCKAGRAYTPPIPFVADYKEIAAGLAEKHKPCVLDPEATLAYETSRGYFTRSQWPEVSSGKEVVDPSSSVTEEGCENLVCDVVGKEEGCDASDSEGKRGTGICGEEGSDGEEELQRRRLFGFINRAEILPTECCFVFAHRENWRSKFSAELSD
ncbi:hypothetical protein U1Q18_029423 [Sarracenia purpurea var. burkii]